MLEGVILLNRYVSTNVVHGRLSILFAIATLFLGIFSAVVITTSICEEHSKKEIIKYSLVVVAFIISAFITYGLTNQTYDTKYYQVIISDDIDYNEFLNRYNITEQEGKIYTITEKIKED